MYGLFTAQTHSNGVSRVSDSEAVATSWITGEDIKPFFWFFLPLQPQSDMEGYAALVRPDLQEEPAPRRGTPVEEERRGSGV